MLEYLLVPVKLVLVDYVPVKLVLVDFVYMIVDIVVGWVAETGVDPAAPIRAIYLSH